MLGRSVLRLLTGCFLIILFITGTNTRAQTITVVNDLTFGDVFPGIPKTISKYTAGAAAEFHVTGTPGAEMIIEFTLPTYMNQSGYNMQMVFQKTDCAMDSSATPDQTNPGLDNQDPWHPITYRLGSNGLTIWLGGMVIPRLSQNPGSYSGTIVLTVTPTGN